MKKFIRTLIFVLLTIVIGMGYTYLADGSTPRYELPRFSNVEDLIEWIETTDAASFQSGRFERGLLSLRNHGEIFIPHFTDPNVNRGQITVILRSTNIIILFDYPTSMGQVTARAGNFDPRYSTVYEEGGISGYYTATRGEAALEISYVSDKIVYTKNSSDGELVEQKISYALVNNISNDGFPIEFTIFAVDGLELGVTRYNVASDEHLGTLIWEAIPITYRPEDRPDDTLVMTAISPVHPEIAHDSSVPRTIRLEIDNPTFTINNIQYTTDAAPFVDTSWNNRVMIPLRAVAEALGVRVDWNPDTRVVVVYARTGTIRFLAGHHITTTIHGRSEIRGNRVFVPREFVSEVLGARVRWDEENSAIYIYE